MPNSQRNLCLEFFFYLFWGFLGMALKPLKSRYFSISLATRSQQIHRLRLFFDLFWFFFGMALKSLKTKYLLMIKDSLNDILCNTRGSPLRQRFTSKSCNFCE